MVCVEIYILLCLRSINERLIVIVNIHEINAAVPRVDKNAI